MFGMGIGWFMIGARLTGCGLIALRTVLTFAVVIAFGALLNFGDDSFVSQSDDVNYAQLLLVMFVWLLAPVVSAIWLYLTNKARVVVR
jgi:hypothetical protein